MPYIPVPAGTLEVRYHFSLPGEEEMVNVLNCQLAVPGAFTSLDMIEVAGAYHDAWADNIRGVQSPDVMLRNITVTDIETATGPQRVVDYNEVGTGSAANPLPLQTAATITWLTDTRGKSFHGRTFFGGFQEDQSNGGLVGALVLAGLNQFTLDLAANLFAIAPAWNRVVVSRYTGGDKHAIPDPIPSAPRPLALTTVVTSHRVSNHWKTQRRRALK